MGNKPVFEPADFSKVREAVMAYPEASIAIFVGGLFIGWGASWLLAHRELKVNRVIISELRQSNISQATKDSLLSNVLPQHRFGPWLKSLGTISIAAIAAAASVWMLQPKMTFSEVRWEPLTSSEISALETNLSKIEPEPVIIACETPNCKDLAKSFSRAFIEAGWHDTKLLFQGGMGITGVSGMSMNPGDDRTTAIISAIEKTTSLKIQPPSYSRTEVKTGPGVFFVIGAKPFSP
jgi:hypothetical protein